MSEGGFVVRFEGKRKKSKGCYAAAFDYDEWSYSVNNGPKKDIPAGTKRIVIEVK